jgi:hypothetical protein
LWLLRTGNRGMMVFFLRWSVLKLWWWLLVSVTTLKTTGSHTLRRWSICI